MRTSAQPALSRSSQLACVSRRFGSSAKSVRCQALASTKEIDQSLNVLAPRASAMCGARPCATDVPPSAREQIGPSLCSVLLLSEHSWRDRCHVCQCLPRGVQDLRSSAEWQAVGPAKLGSHAAFAFVDWLRYEYESGLDLLLLL